MSREQQIELEELMSEVGSRRFYESIEQGDDFQSPMVQKIAKTILIPFSEFIDKQIKRMAITRGRKNKLVLFVEGNGDKSGSSKLTGRELAYMTVESIFSDSLMKDKGNDKLTRVAMVLSRNLLKWRPMMGDESTASSYTLIEWFSNLFSELVTLKQTKTNKSEAHTSWHLEKTQAFYDFIDDSIEVMAEMSTIYCPMISPPNPWDSQGLGGGYYSDNLQRNLVKHQNLRKGAGVSEPMVMAFNAIQATEWSINKDIVDVFNILSTNPPSTLKKIFPPEVPKNLPSPTTKSYSRLNKAEKILVNEWNSTNKKNLRDRKAKQSKDMTRIAAMKQAADFSEYEKIYFPVDADYRGRGYCISQTGVSTQGSDIQKALIKIGPSVVKTHDGERWMKINMANLVGEDKLKLDKRIDWTNSNEMMIRDVAKDPIKCTLWHEWDKPAQGLAAAMEYVKWLDYPELAVNTHVQQDGLCNGVQHLAALTRDHRVAPHVGLVPTDERGDVYGLVADTVINNIMGDNSAFAKEWLMSALITRKLAKKPVMTRSYAAKLYGIQTGIIDFIEDEEASSFFKDYFSAGIWMGERVWESMDKALVGPMQFLEWVQACAKIMGMNNIPMIWTNPMGQNCIHKPLVTIPTSFSVSDRSVKHKYTIHTPTNTINWRKMMSSCSPNLTHGNDGSHLVGTTNRSAARGVNRFAMVHDSFGTIPDHAQILLDETKESWVDQYDKDWLNIWHQEWEELMPASCRGELPPPSEFIEIGNLDITAVRDSDFFFA